jgi:acetyl-CoA carboxylase carboxyltransferase component
MKKSDTGTGTKQSTRLRELTDQLQTLEAKLRLGGGLDKIDRQHQQGKLTARERIELLLDKDAYAQEIGLLVAYDQYDGGAPGAGVVTVVGKVEGRRSCARRRSRCARACRSFTSSTRPA